MMKRSMLAAFAALMVMAPLARLTAQAVSVPMDAELRASAASAQVRPGDRIALRIWMEPEMSDTFRVAQNGDVVLPKLGAVRVNGQQVAALEDSLRVAYSEFLRNPSVEVTVLRRVAVHGEVRNPDLYWVDLTMTLRDVLALAGGVTEAGNPNRISIVRGSETLRFAQSEGSAVASAELQSGDEVVVGRDSWIARNPFAVVGTGMGVVTFMMQIILPMLR
jgi:protein involved in polysaccharide export with SLBB domain